MDTQNQNITLGHIISQWQECSGATIIAETWKITIFIDLLESAHDSDSDCVEH
jgi:hypothetical protein